MLVYQRVYSTIRVDTLYSTIHTVGVTGLIKARAARSVLKILIQLHTRRPGQDGADSAYTILHLYIYIYYYVCMNIYLCIYMFLDLCLDNKPLANWGAYSHFRKWNHLQRSQKNSQWYTINITLTYLNIQKTQWTYENHMSHLIPLILLESKIRFHNSPYTSIPVQMIPNVSKCIYIYGIPLTSLFLGVRLVGWRLWSFRCLHVHAAWQIRASQRGDAVRFFSANGRPAMWKLIERYWEFGDSSQSHPYLEDAASKQPKFFSWKGICVVSWHLKDVDPFWFMKPDVFPAKARYVGLRGVHWHQQI